MKTFTLLFSVLSLLSLAWADDFKTISVLAWPLSAESPSVLAKVMLNTGNLNATVAKYIAPTIADSDSIVRVGFKSTGGAWAGIATSASNLAPNKQKTLLLHLNAQGDIYHVGFQASELPRSSASGQGKDGLEVQVVSMKDGPKIFLDRPVVVNEQGEVEGKEPEKSFFQKYWWVMAGFVLVQLVMAGGKE